jgi:hypothetical protein
MKLKKAIAYEVEYRNSDEAIAEELTEGENDFTGTANVLTMRNQKNVTENRQISLAVFSLYLININSNYWKTFSQI